MHVRFIEGVSGVNRAIAERPLLRFENVERFVFVEFFHGADFRNQLFGFFRADRGVPVGVLVIEDEVHFVLPRSKRR